MHVSFTCFIHVSSTSYARVMQFICNRYVRGMYVACTMYGRGADGRTFGGWAREAGHRRRVEAGHMTVWRRVDTRPSHSDIILARDFYLRVQRLLLDQRLPLQTAWSITRRELPVKRVPYADLDAIRRAGGRTQRPRLLRDSRRVAASSTARRHDGRFQPLGMRRVPAAGVSGRGEDASRSVSHLPPHGVPGGHAQSGAHASQARGYSKRERRHHAQHARGSRRLCRVGGGQETRPILPSAPQSRRARLASSVLLVSSATNEKRPKRRVCFPRWSSCTLSGDDVCVCVCRVGK